MIQKKTIQKSGLLTRRQSRFNSWRRVSPAGLIILAALGIITACQFIAPAGAAAQMNQDPMDKVLRDPNLPWRLEADEINYDQSSDEYSARGNVLIYKGNIKLLADFVRFDHQNMKAYAEGNVILTNGEDILRGTSMEMDLENQIGSVKNGYLFLKENNYHLTGDLIKKVGKNTYTIDEATLTTCDGSPVEGNHIWSINSSIGSIIDQNGFYASGDTDHNVTDVVMVFDVANGNIMDMAAIDVVGTSIRVSPDAVLRSHLLWLPVWFDIRGTNIHFELPSIINFSSSEIIYPIFQLYLGADRIGCFCLVSPILSQDTINTVELAVLSPTVPEGVNTTVTIITLPWIL